MEKTLRDYAYYKMTQGMCRTCRSIVNARIVEKNGSIIQENLCPDCGHTESLIAEDSAWYFEHVNTPIKTVAPKTVNTPVKNGCPYDCGACAFHENRANLPVFSITNACNMNCPICFTYNRNDTLYFMSLEEMKKTVDFLLSSNESYDLINITGGEPTLHQDLVDLIKIATHEKIGRITVNSNGIRLSQDEDLVRKLADLGVYIILSFDTLDRETSLKIHGEDVVGAKLKALDNMARHGIGVTLLFVMIKGVNDHEIHDIIRLSETYPNIRSITIQTMTFTGQGGGLFSPRERITLDMASRRIEETSETTLSRSHFFPLPSNHPLCYSIAYYFKTDQGLKSFTDILPKEKLIDLIGSNYIMHPDDVFYDTFNEAITTSWVTDTNTDLLRFIKKLLKTMYPKDRQLTPFERQQIAETSILTVYIHAHMDEENFDISRIVCCTDLVPVDGERLIPACAYNLFYRMKDKRFWYENAKEGENA